MTIYQYEKGVIFMGIAIIAIMVAFYVATVYIDKNVFPKIYEETSINPFGFFHKVLCVVMGACFFLLMPVEDGISEFFVIGILIEVVSIGLFALLNLRYKDPKMIAKITGIHAIFGIAFSVRFLIWFLSFAVNLAGLFLGGSWQFGSSVKLFGGFKEVEPETHEGSNIIDSINKEAQTRSDNIAAANEAERARNNEAAEAYASSHGFSSADEAESFGVKTGKIE